MSFINQTISIFNYQHDFFLSAATTLHEPKQHIKKATRLIIQTIIKALSQQQHDSYKAGELYRIAKDCHRFQGALSFNNPQLHIKGKGANTEIFGVHLSAIVNEIAEKSASKNNSVNTLFSILTPAVLYNIYQVSVHNKFSIKQAHGYIKNLSGRYRRIPYKITDELNKLFTENTTATVEPQFNMRRHTNTYSEGLQEYVATVFKQSREA